jgi:hypothetical protein
MRLKISYQCAFPSLENTVKNKADLPAAYLPLHDSIIAVNNDLTKVTETFMPFPRELGYNGVN